MQRLQHLFQRAVLALALLTSGLAGGYALHDPGASRIQPCRADAAGSEAAPQPIYSARWAASGAHSACSCGNA